MKTVPLDTFEMAVADEGRGAVLLLVHGFPLDHSMWSEQLGALDEAMRVIAPDLRGFGGSRSRDEVVGMEQYADDLAQLLDALNIREPVTFCGLSMGGYIGWQFWRKYRNRLKALVLCDTRAVADTPEGATARYKTADEVLAKGPQALAEGMLPKLFAPESFARRPEVVEATKRVILQTDPQAIAAAARGMAARPDVTEDLPEIDVPTLVLVGEHDQIATVEEMRMIAETIPESEWLVVPEAGHMAPLENPDVVNTALRQFMLQVQQAT